MTKEEIIVTVICALLGSSVLNGLITHILYKGKLEKDLKNKGHDMIAQEIGKSLQFVRDMELQLTIQELYNVQSILKQRGSQVNLFDGEAIYPAIFNDWDSYNSFREIIQECRNKYEKNLPVKIALNLVFIERYINQLSLFLKENGDEELLPFWGTIFIVDLKKWQRKMDKLLVKEINKYTYKLESHETKKWTKMREKVLIEQFQRTILYYLLNGKCRKRDRKKMELVRNTLDNIFATQDTVE